MSGTVKAGLAVVIAAMVVASCGRTEGKTGDGGRPPVAVEVAAVAPATIERSVEAVGTLEPKFVADVKSEFTGVVDEVYVTQWVHVEKGTPLARLDTREAEAVVRAAGATAAQADVADTRAERELERAVNLKAYGLVTQQALDDARSARDAASAAAQAAHAQLAVAQTRLAKAMIRAPMTGTVALRAVSVGDRVENMGGGPMFRIVDTRILELTMMIPSSRSAAVRVGQPVQFTVDALPGRTFTGEVKYINPVADPVSRTVKVMADVPNTGGELRGGTFVKGVIRTGERAGVLRVPRVALLSWDVERGSGEVFVIAGDTAERRTVRTGEISGEFVEIVEGLAAGDRVVTRGGFNLRPGDRVQVAPASGEHAKQREGA
jgi:membrane fusion protein (multidrug efflux system)